MFQKWPKSCVTYPDISSDSRYFFNSLTRWQVATSMKAQNLGTACGTLPQ
jgi:hypothetical protein